MTDLPIHVTRSLHVSSVQELAIHLILLGALGAWCLLDYRSRQ